MKHLKTFENHGISIIECEKSRESYDFVSQYLDLIDFESYIKNENLHQVCAYTGKELVAVCIFRMKDGKIHMNYSAVDVTFRRQGINKKLKNKVIQIGKDNGCHIITANVRESNKTSLNSLLSVGFKVNDRVNLTYPDGEKKIPLYLNI
jgi:ribosomal protein S18 acetylase RimI-like enzyme